MRTSSIKIALIATFASLQALLTIFPFTITVGVSGQITLGVIGGPLIGILLGPVMGGLAVLIGSLAGVFLNPSGAIFGVLSVIPPFFGALGAGCVRERRSYLAGIIILASLLIFYAHPYGREAPLYPWLHIIAMIIAFSPIAGAAGSGFQRIEDNRKHMLGFSVFIAAFIGVLTDHITGSALGMWYFYLYFPPGITPNIWNLIMYIYPIERIVSAILILLIATPTYYGLRRAGFIGLIRRGGR